MLNPIRGKPSIMVLLCNNCGSRFDAKGCCPKCDFKK